MQEMISYTEVRETEFGCIILYFLSELNKIGHRNAHKTSFRYYSFGKNGPSGSSSLLRGVKNFYSYVQHLGTAVAQWLRCRITNRKVVGSILAGLNGFFSDTKSFISHYGPGVDSASNRNEYQEYFLGVKAAGA